MIIIGTRGVTLSPDSGNFYCPNCKARRTYKHKVVRRFFTVFFIPIIPLDKLGEYYECQVCKNTYNAQILTHDPEAESRRIEAEYHAGVKRVLVHMLLADGLVEDQEIKAIQSIYEQMTKTELAEGAVRSEIERVKTENATLETSIAKFRGLINEHGKEMVLRAACVVAAADGLVQAQEQEMLTNIGKALEMTPAHIRGVLAEVFEGQN